MSAGEHNQLLKNIERVFLKIGLDQNFLKASKKHLEVMQKYFFKRENIRTKKDLCITFLSKLFMDKLDMYPCKRKDACQVEEHFDSNFKICPSELFGEEKLTEHHRIACFFDCLKAGDILECQVAEVLKEEYRLRVINKYGSQRLLCDLNITISLPQNKLETELLKFPLKTGEYVRVLIENEFGTIDEQKLPVSRKHIKLGRINKMELPHFVLNAPKNCATLLEYLKTQPELTNMPLFNFILISSGLDLKKQYSYYPNIDSIKNLNEPTGQMMLKEAQTKDIENYMSLALTEKSNGNFEKALEAIDEALQISKSTKLYLIKGSLHVDMEKPRLSKKALLDLELAYQLDKNNPIVRKSLSHALSTAAIKFYKSKMYQKADTAGKKALFLNKSNKDAAALVEYLRNNHLKYSDCNDQNMKEIVTEHFDLSKVKKEAIKKQ